MKKCLSVIMMILSLLFWFQQGIVFMHFKLNQEEIEQKFCVNKNKPALRCHGYCQLQKKLQQAEKSASNNTITLFQRDLFPTPFFTLEIDLSSTIILFERSIFKMAIYRAPSLEIVVPPPLLSRLKTA